VDSKASLGQQQNAAGGKSSHMAAVRSLGLLHEVNSTCAAAGCCVGLHAGLQKHIAYKGLAAVLCTQLQEYVSTLQQAAVEHKEEVRKLRGEKEVSNSCHSRLNAAAHHSICMHTTATCLASSSTYACLQEWCVARNIQEQGSTHAACHAAAVLVHIKPAT
jgi:hypothetical protein